MTDTFAAPTRRAVLRIEGPDAETYLQGQLSQDLDQLAVDTSTWSLVLQPQGKVDAWARVTKVAADAFLLDVDADHDPAAGDALEARLRRFLLRTKAEITRLDWDAVAVRGADAPRGELPENVLRCAVVGPGVEGYDLLGPAASAPDAVVAVDGRRLEAHRIAHGVPATGAELTPDTIPAELGAWFIEESVSFTKGCYVGQELTARIDSRGGNVPRRVRILRAEGPVGVGDDVLVDGDVVGAVTSAAEHPDHGSIALAPCKRVVEPGQQVVVGTGVAATVADPPLA